MIQTHKIFSLYVCRNYLKKEAKNKTCRARELPRNKWCKACVGKRSADCCVFRQKSCGKVSSSAVKSNLFEPSANRTKIKTCRSRKLPKNEWCKNCVKKGRANACAFRQNLRVATSSCAVESTIFIPPANQTKIKICEYRKLPKNEWCKSCVKKGPANACVFRQSSAVSMPAKNATSTAVSPLPQKRQRMQRNYFANFASPKSIDKFSQLVVSSSCIGKCPHANEVCNEVCDIHKRSLK